MPARYRSILLACAAIVAGVWLVFGRCVEAEFLQWDDDHNIYNNPHLRELNGENLRWMFLDVGRDTRYKALSWLGWALIAQVFGMKPAAFHAANVILHAVNACLCFALLLRFCGLLRSATDSGQSTERREIVCAALGALVWALHPLRVEPVAWVTGFPYHLSLLFLLVALIAYLGLDFTRPVYRQGGYWAMLGSYTAAMMSYPMPIGGVALFVGLNLFPLSRIRLRWLTDPGNRRVALELSPLLAISALMLGIAVYGAHVRVGIFADPPDLSEFPLTHRVAQAAYVWCYYLWKPLLPFGLSPVYLTLSDIRPEAPVFLLSLVALGGLSLTVFRRRHDQPALVAFWLAHLGVLAPVLGVNVLHHVAADRYSIIHGILLSMALAWGLSRIVPEERFNRARLVVAAVVLCLGLLSWRQARIWRDNLSFFAYQAETLPDSGPRAVALFRLGNEYFRRGNLAEAVKYFEAADRAFPGIRLPEKPFRHGEALFALGRFREAEAQYRAALELRQDAPEIWYGLGQSLLAQGRLEEVVPLFERASDLHPNIPEFHDDLARIHEHRGEKEKAAFHREAARRIRVSAR